MTDERLTSELAVRGMGWRLAPGRYIKTHRSWLPLWKFRPLSDIRDAFRLLDYLTDDYFLRATPTRAFSAEVRLNGRVGRAFGEPMARIISLAIARAMALDVAPESV